MIVIKVYSFVVAHKEAFMPLAALAYSEFLSLNPKYKSNGLVQAVGSLFKKGK